MRHSLRIFTLLLCLVYLSTAVSAAVPVPMVLTEADPASGTEQISAASIDSEPGDPEDPEPGDPEDPEPGDPEDPQPGDPEPEEPEIPVSEMTDEQIIEKYAIPNNWARSGLIFAVRNGILAGKNGQGLCPKDNATHAELATMLMGILKTDKCESLERFTDVRPKDWFVEPMGKAVSLGIFPIADHNATLLTPKKNITREEAFVAIARVFGIHGNGRQAIYGFSDWRDVSEWAAEDLTAMIEAGYLGGSDGKIMPKREITRQEVAVILSNLLTKVDTALDADVFDGKLALAAGTVAPGTVINGDLLLSSDASYIRLDEVTVTGRLILQGNGALSLKLIDCEIGELVFCRPTTLEANDTVSNVTSYAMLKLYCDVSTLQVYDHFVLPAGQTVDTVNAMNHAAITVSGTVNHMQVLGDNVYINGKGTIKTLHQHGIGLSNSCKTESVTGTVRLTLEDANAARQDNGVPNYDAPKATLSLKVQNIPEEWSECDLLWVLNETDKTQQKRVLLKNGCTASLECSFSKYINNFLNKVPLKVYLISPNGSQKLLYSGEVKLDVVVAIARKATAARTDKNVPSWDSSKAAVTLKLQNMSDNPTCFDLLWVLDGTVKNRHNGVQLKNGSVVSQNYDFSDYVKDGSADKLPLQVYLIAPNGYQKLLYSADVKLDVSVAVALKATASRTDKSIPKWGAPKATVSLKLANMTNNQTSFDVLWVLDGKVKDRDKGVSLKNGSTISWEYNFNDYVKDGSVNTVPLKVYLVASNGYQRKIYSGDIKLDVTVSVANKATAVRIDKNVPNSESPIAAISLKLQNMPKTENSFDVLWVLDGTVKNQYKGVQLKNGSTVSQEYNFSKYLNGSADKVPLQVYVIASNGYRKLVYSGEIKVIPALEAQARKIRTQNVQGKLKQYGTLYTNMGLSGAIKSYPAGTQVTVLQSRHSSYTKVRMPDGNEGWMSFSNVQIISGNYYTTTDYATPVKEYYVNHVRNCSSQTSYLIWVSLYTQRINIFQGSKGNWKLVQSGPIASGRNECPTPVEVTKIKYKTAQWTYSSYYCHHVSVFDEARGFHSRPTAYDGSIYSAAIGHPASAGCVRLLDAECVFIYNNCPIGTAVYIY